MTKVNYPINGIYKDVESIINSISNNLDNAIGKTYNEIPSNFVYLNYFNELSSNLSDYKDEIDLIAAKIQNTDENFKKLDLDLIDSVNNLNSITIKDRERMIN